MPKFKTLYERQMELATVQQPKPTIAVGHTPIEIALGIDEQGRTTARKLYAFLELNKTVYARWCRNNITENDFAEENVDYEVLDINVENSSSSTSLSENSPSKESLFIRHQVRVKLHSSLTKSKKPARHQCRTKKK